MNEKTENTDGKQPDETATEPQTIPVLTRFYRDELDEMKNDTGANADATAVACFVRKNLRKKGGQ